MKKKILCFIFAFVFMFPFAFMLSGCFGEQPPSDPPSTEQGSEGNGNEDNSTEQPLTAQAIISELNKVERDNFTANINLEYSLKEYEIIDNLPGAGKTEGNSLPTISVKLDGNNGYLNSPDMQGYFLDDQRYEVDENGELSVFLSNKVYSDQYTEIIDIVQQFSNAEIFSAFVQVSNLFGTDCIKIVEKENETVVTFDLKLASSITTIVKTINENRANSMYVLINELLSDIKGADFDIMDVITEFETDFTENTTVGDLLNFLSSKTGLTFNTLFEKICNINKIYSKVNDYDIDYIGGVSDYNFCYGNVDGYVDYISRQDYVLADSDDFVSFDGAADIKLAELIDTSETTKTAKELIFDSIKEFLNDETLTYESLLENSEEDSFIHSFDETITLLSSLNFKQADVKTTFSFDKNYNINSVVLDVLADVTEVDEETKDGFGAKYSYCAKIDFTNIGTTTIKIPTNIIADYIAIDLYINASDLVNLSTYLSKQLNFKYALPSFSLIGYKEIEPDVYSTTPTTFISYSANTKLLLIDSEFLLNALTMEDVNNVRYVFTTSDNGYDFTYNIDIVVVAE